MLFILWVTGHGARQVGTMPFFKKEVLSACLAPTDYGLRFMLPIEQIFGLGLAEPVEECLFIFILQEVGHGR